MNKEMKLETNDEGVDLSRRSMMGRFGLMASLACAAPVLMTVSTSALANHKSKDKNEDNSNGNAANDKGQGWGCEGHANGASSGDECADPDTTPPIDMGL